MICTISFTICGLKTSLLVSFLDKHTPWISGRPAYLLLNLHPIITRKTTLTQLTNYHVAEKITKKITKPSLKFKAEFQHQQPVKIISNFPPFGASYVVCKLLEHLNKKQGYCKPPSLEKQL